MSIQDLTPQLRTRLRKVEWITGLFLGVTALLMLGGFFYFVKQTAVTRGWFITYVPYYTYMPDATGFKPGTPVKMMGFNVGEVTEVNAVGLEARASWDYYQTNNFNVFVAFKIKEPYFGYIGADARVQIGGFPVELAGGNFIELNPSSNNSMLTVVTNLPDGKRKWWSAWGRSQKSLGVLWDKYAYTPEPKFAQYGALTNKQKGYYLELNRSETLLAQAQRILKNADEITAFLRQDLPQVATEAVNTLNSARSSINSLTNDVVLTLITAREAVASLTNDLAGLVGNTRRITGQVADVIPGLTNDIARTLASSQQLMDAVNLQLPSIAQNVNLTLTNLNVLLLRDTNIMANTSLLVSNVNNLLIRHWLFRSAFKPAKPAPKPRSPVMPSDPASESSRPTGLHPSDLRGAGRQ